MCVDDDCIFVNMNWNKLNTKTQLQTIFIFTVVLSLVLICGSCILFAVVVGNTTTTNVYDGFDYLAISDMKEITKIGGLSFDGYIRKMTQNFPNIMTSTTNDLYRNDSVYSYIKSYYNYPNTLVNEHYNASYNANITYYSSSYNVYNTTPNEIDNLPSSIKETINTTAPMDYFFPFTFSISSDFFAGYMATPEKFFRYYPGAINYDNVDNYIMYNNVNRYWYQTVMSNSNVTYTAPYVDYVSGYLMITIGRQIIDPNNKNIIGAFGSDFTLTKIQENIKNLTYLENGRSILFEKETGYVIADSYQNISNIITYNEITNPTINSNVWNYLKTHNDVIKNGDYYFASVGLESTNNAYMLVTIANKNDVLATYSKIVDNVVKSNTETMYSIGFVTVGLLVILCVALYSLVNSIVVPIKNLTNVVDEMANNIGKTKITKGVNYTQIRSGIREIDDLQNQFEMVMYGEQEKPKNEYYNCISWENVINPNTIPTSHPPDYYATNVCPSAPPMVIARVIDVK